MTTTRGTAWFAFADLTDTVESKLAWQVDITMLDPTAREHLRRQVTDHVDAQAAAAAAAGWKVIDSNVYEVTENYRRLVRGYAVVQPPLPGLTP